MRTQAIVDAVESVETVEPEIVQLLEEAVSGDGTLDADLLVNAGERYERAKGELAELREGARSIRRIISDLATNGAYR